MAGMVSLSRVDYMQVNPCEHRGTLKLLPFGGHKRQRVVVGDDSGALVCFGIKKYETKMHFTAPLGTDAGISDVYITRGSNGESAGRIFSSSGTSIAGVNRKGKVYFSFKSNMSEGIENLHVEDRHIWATGEYVFCSFDENGRELHYYMCPDRINHMLMLQNNKAGNFALLGCQDSTLRIVRGDRLELDMAVSGAVRSVAELHAVPFRARTAKEEDPEFNRRGSLLGRFSRKGKDKKKSKKKGKDKFEDNNTSGGQSEGKVGDGGNAGGEGKIGNDNTSKFDSPEDSASMAVSSAVSSNTREHNLGDVEKKGSEGVSEASSGRSADALKTSFVYGTTTGGIGAITVEGGVGQRSWFVQPPVSGEASAANCVVVDDLTGDGVNDMILARDNGSVQVWSLGGNAGDEGFREENFGGASRGERIRKCAEYDIGESVRSLDIGVMSTPGFDELVVCTYSGRIVSLTTEPLSDAAIDDKYGRTKAVVGKETQVKAFRAELKELQKQVSKETEKLQKARGDSDEGKSKSKSSRGDKDGSGNSSGKHMFTASKFSVNHSFELMERDATYQLVLEIPFPIISVVLQTDVPVDLLRQDVSTSVIMSPTRSLILGDARGTKHDIHNNPGSAKTNDDRTTEAHQVLATYRPTDDKMRRIKIGLRSVEGQHGVLNAYVVSGGDSKTAHAVRLSIKPLSMHARIKDITPQQESSIPWNTLSFNGDFSISQAHSWVSFCLPALPPHFTSARGADGREQARLCFINAFVKSHLLVTYEDSDLTFKSDSVTTITILKQVITKHATNLGLKVRISTDLNRDSVPHFLRLLNPKMQAQFQLSRQMQLARAMSEITEFGDDASYLDPELQYVVKNREAIKEAFDESKRVLEILYGMVTDLYIDVKQQISGQSSASAQVPLLMQLLKEYQIDDVAAFVLKAFR